MLRLIQSLALGDDHQQPPEVVAIVEPRVSPARRAPYEAVEGVERRVLLVGHGAGSTAQPGARQPDQRLEIAAPELVSSFGFAGFQRLDPDPDRVALPHVDHAAFPRRPRIATVSRGTILTRGRSPIYISPDRPCDRSAAVRGGRPTAPPGLSRRTGRRASRDPSGG